MYIPFDPAVPLGMYPAGLFIHVETPYVQGYSLLHK